MASNIFKSKYVNKVISLSKIYDSKDEILPTSGSDSDSESDTEFTDFIIDSKPETNIHMFTNNRQQKPIFGSTIESDFKVEPYLSSTKTPEESVKLVDQMSIKAMNEELDKKLVIKPGFEQNYCIKSFTESKRKRKLKRKEENDKTLGQKWFGMKANELTDEKKNDLLALSMRRGWDPKRFYKKNDSKEVPKFFQIGTIIESKADFYHSRVPKKDRKRTLVEELLADAEFKRYNKKRYSEALAKNPYYLKMRRRKQRQEKGDNGIDFKKKRNDKKIKNKDNKNLDSNQ